MHLNDQNSLTAPASQSIVVHQLQLRWESIHESSGRHCRLSSPKGTESRSHRRALAAEVIFSPRFLLICFLTSTLLSPALAATKPHVIAFGKWTQVNWVTDDSGGERPAPVKVRPLIIDGRTKEYIIGSTHEITERLFVVRRMFRVNDSLPDDPLPQWQWQRGGWLLVDRLTGHISPLNLPDFDSYYSAASWYRDYVAYCGVSDDGKKTYAMVAQLNRRKPVLKKALSEGLADNAAPDSACPPPVWQRLPVRVAFELSPSEKHTFEIRGHVVDVVTEEDDE